MLCRVGSRRCVSSSHPHLYHFRRTVIRRYSAWTRMEPATHSLFASSISPSHVTTRNVSTATAAAKPQPQPRVDSIPMVPASTSSSSSIQSHIIPDPEITSKHESFELKDPDWIFRQVWNKLLAKYGEEKMSFPKDIMWLAGAPGAGKGQMTPLLLEYRGITCPPLEVSALLTTPEARKMKSEGKLVGDREVVELLLEALLRPEYKHGVLVDGFPRTKEQAECIKKLYDQMQLLRHKYMDTPLYASFQRPIFHITVLYIDKDESVRRQLRRGKLAQQHNDIVMATGVGTLKPVRETDLDPHLAAERYRHFRDSVYEALQSVKDKFHFHFIDASGPVQEVQERIIKELQYQSSMELNDETFEVVRQIPLASEIILHARHELVQRLDRYQQKNAALFSRVVQLIKRDFAHILRRQALAGRAIVRSDNDIFREPEAIDMALDLLCERGFVAVLDVVKKQEPTHFDLKTGRITSSETRLYEFQIEFPRPTIRKG